MLKKGFRGERKRILTPSLSQGEGECSDGKVEGNVVKMFFFTHTPLSRGTYPAVAGYLQRGNEERLIGGLLSNCHLFSLWQIICYLLTK